MSKLQGLLQARSDSRMVVERICRPLRQTSLHLVRSVIYHTNTNRMVIASFLQEVVTQWMAVQEQWVRLAPAFVPPDLDIGVPSHERIRFTDVSRCVIVLDEANCQFSWLSTLLDTGRQQWK